jgi:CitMHS family citrate-Mg2+:H+ or citrate-Ca2+:H+ symporter
MLAIAGFASVGLLLALILTKRASPLVALVIVPVVAAFAVGQGASLGQHVTSGIQQTAPMAATFVFAIIHFGVMADAGLLDPAIDWILRVVGSNPVRIVMGSALLAALVHLDGSGATTFLITIPALLPLYDRLGMDRRVLACVVAMAAGVMNILPWGGPLLRAATALQVTSTALFVPLVPAVAAGLAFLFAAAYWMGKREDRRLRGRDAVPSEMLEPHARALTDAERALRRPKMLWLNLALTVAVLVTLVFGWIPPALAFMLAAVVALVANYPRVADQRERVDAHAKAALMMATILLAAGAFTGVMKGTGMLTAMASAAVSVVPPAMASHIPFLVGILSMPLSLLFDPDSFYFGVLPVVAEVASVAGVPAIQVGQAALLGQMTTGFPVSPLTPATFLLVGLSRLDLAEHQRFTIPWLLAVSILMTFVCVLVGVFSL